MSKTNKIGIITSKGGHLYQMYLLKPWWSKYRRFWVSFRGSDVSSLLKKEKVIYAHYPESRNIPNAFRNLFVAWKVLRKERPDLLISCGAGIAPPFFLVGKILGIKLCFIEAYDFISYPSLSARMVAPIVDHLLVQQKIQKKFFKKAEFKGAIL